MRILIVEDDHKIARALKRGLEQEKFAVDVEYDGQTGYGAASTIPYNTTPETTHRLSGPARNRVGMLLSAARISNNRMKKCGTEK